MYNVTLTLVNWCKFWIVLKSFYDIYLFELKILYQEKMKYWIFYLLYYYKIQHFLFENKVKWYTQKNKYVYLYLSYYVFNIYSINKIIIY